MSISEADVERHRCGALAPLSDRRFVIGLVVAIVASVVLISVRVASALV